jgi:feruloyl-CoA synthase
MNTPKFRPLKFGVTRVQMREGASGVRYMAADQKLNDYPSRMTDRLAHWASVQPETTIFAKRVRNADGSLGDWRHISYAQAWQSARAIAQALIDRSLSCLKTTLSTRFSRWAVWLLGFPIALPPRLTRRSARTMRSYATY